MDEPLYKYVSLHFKMIVAFFDKMAYHHRMNSGLDLGSPHHHLGPQQ